MKDYCTVRDGALEWTASSEVLVKQLRELGWQALERHGYYILQEPPKCEDYDAYSELCSYTPYFENLFPETVECMEYHPDITGGNDKWLISFGLYKELTES